MTALVFRKLQTQVLLAPLSGITDVPFRRLVRGFGTSIVFSEMVASGEFLKRDTESLRRAMADGDGVHAIQLAGRHPATMREAAALAVDLGAEWIDINFGCPAKKVVGGLSGSALMREPDLALRIVEATVEGARGTRVTVKMRLGWDRRSINAPAMAARAESAGVAMVTVHGRTRDQFYEGSADWAAIAAVSDAVSIPVIANGDLVDPEQLATMLRASQADGVMIGRGACGRPWLPALVAGCVSWDELRRIDLAVIATEHFASMLSFHGAGPGLRQARKHIGWYLDHAETVRSLPAQARSILRMDEPALVERELRSLLGGLTAFDIERARNETKRTAA